MVTYDFYTDSYLGDSIPEADFPRLSKRAGEQLARYNRLYTVTAPETDSENMAVCAMAEALYEFAQLQDAGGAVQSVSVGNVSENRAAVAAPDTSAAAQAAELYRRAGLYADIYRGC